MAKMFGEKDANPNALKGKKVVVLGYGSQGRNQSLNLRDSGIDVVVGLRPGGKTWEVASGDGFRPEEPSKAVQGADVVMMLCPDMAQPSLYKECVEPNMKKGAMLLFSHGFNIHYGQIQPSAEIDVAMIAPKSPGRLVRTEYQAGKGVPCLIAVHQDATKTAQERALAYAHALGGTRAGVMQTTFAEETETDLFGEQAVLCGGVTELVTAGFETLVEAGYQPEAAYFECMHELKLIVDLMYEGGITKMMEAVSETAKYGDVTRGPRVVDASTKDRMKQILEEIRSGAFATEWVLECQANKPRYNALVNREVNHPIEKVGKELRSRMSWLQK